MQDEPLTLAPSEPGPEPRQLRRMAGPQRAAALMLMLGPDGGRPLWRQFADHEVQELSAAMLDLRPVEPEAADWLGRWFLAQMQTGGALHGSAVAAERLLSAVFDPEKAKAMLADAAGKGRGPVWDRVTRLPEGQLSAFLAAEQPQTAAVILSRMPADRAAAVLAQLPDAVALQVIACRLSMGPVPREAMQQVERVLQADLIAAGPRQAERDPHAAMAELFDALDRAAEERLMAALEVSDPDAAARIRALMFTFEDLQRLPPEAMQALVRRADKQRLALALKGVDDAVRDLFLGAMATRAGALLRDAIADLGPQRIRDVQAAQSELVRLAKSMADAGEIMLSASSDDEDLVE